MMISAVAFNELANAHSPYALAPSFAMMKAIAGTDSKFRISGWIASREAPNSCFFRFKTL